MWISSTTAERHRIVGFLDRNAMLALLLAASLQPAGSVAQNASGDTDAQYTAEGSQRCLSCHGGPRMLAVAETAHGNLNNPFTPYSKQGCESCHGPGSLHVSRARGGIGFPAMLAFRKDEPASRKNAACLSCHANEMGTLEGMAWADSIHDAAGLSCTSCHQGHTPGNPLAERGPQVELCATCHSAQITNHRRFENVGIVFDELKCFNCHDVHQMTREP